MKRLENQYLIEYQTKLDAYQEKLDDMQYKMIPISRADESEYWRLHEIVTRLKNELGKGN